MRWLLVIKPQFVAFARFHEGLASVCTRKGYGLIDQAGNLVVPPAYDAIGTPSEGMIPFMANEFEKGRRYGYLDRSGNVVIEPNYKHARPFSEGLAAVEKEHLWGYITPSGSFQIDLQFEGAKRLADGVYVGISPGEFVHGIAPVWVRKRAVFIDRRGQIRISRDFDEATPFSEERALVRQGGKIGYIDTQGKVVIEPRFSYGRSFSEGLAAVQYDNRGKVGFVDRLGNWVVEPRFSRTARFWGGLCRVETEHSVGYIDEAGDLVWEGVLVEHGWY